GGRTVSGGDRDLSRTRGSDGRGERATSPRDAPPPHGSRGRSRRGAPAGPSASGGVRRPIRVRRDPPRDGGGVAGERQPAPGGRVRGEGDAGGLRLRPAGQS